MIMDVGIIILSGIVTTIAGYLGWLAREMTKEIRKTRRDNDQVIKAVTSLLRSSITRDFARYKKVGQLSSLELENIIKAIELHDALGGYPPIDHIRDRLREFDIVD